MLCAWDDEEDLEKHLGHAATNRRRPITWTAAAANQRRNSLRFLNRHELRRLLVFDDFQKQPWRRARDRGGEIYAVGPAAL
jgi:hypothetical protein